MNVLRVFSFKDFSMFMSAAQSNFQTFKWIKLKIEIRDGFALTIVSDFTAFSVFLHVISEDVYFLLLAG